MKTRSLLRKLFLLSISCILSFVSLPVHAEDKVTFLISEFPPYEFTQNGKIVGVDVEIVEQVFKRLGYKVSIEVMPWARAQIAAKEGKVTGLFSLLKNPEREQNYYFTMPIGTIRNVLFKLKKHKVDWTNYSDLKNERLVINKGYAYDAEFMQAINSGVIQSVYTLSSEKPEIQMLRMLILDHIDLAIADINLMQYIIKSHAPEFDSIDYVDKTIGDIVNYYIGISKMWPDAENIVRDFNFEFIKFTDEGKTKEIFTKHGLYYPGDKMLFIK